MNLLERNISAKAIMAILILVILSFITGYIFFSDSCAGIRGKIKAYAGDPEEQYRLGVMYSMGIGVQKDPVRALKWLSGAGLAGHAPSAYLAALMYTEGRGTDVDHGKAVKWYRMAAEKDFAPAQAALGRIYTEGRGVDKNIKEGIRWKETAAKQGNASAIYDMGLMYYKGEFVERDEGEAIRWFTAGAKIGDRGSQYYLGLIKFRDGYIDEAVSLISKAADKNYPEALLDLGVIYLTGQGGVKQDPAKSYTLFTKAAKSGVAEAAYFVGMMGLLGIGTEQNTKTAFSFIEKAAKTGHREALYIKGVMLRDGTACTADINKAAKAFMAAAEMDLPEAMREYGRYLYERAENGSAVQKAFEQIERAAKKLDPDSFILMGRIADKGRHPSKKNKSSAEYYRKASLLGSANASFILGQKYELGDGVKQDLGEAVFFYARAIAQASVDRGVIIPSSMSPLNRTTGIQYPVWSFNEAPGRRYGAMAEYSLGMMYFWGRGMPVDRKRGMELIRSAASRGNPEAVNMISSQE